MLYPNVHRLGGPCLAASALLSIAGARLGHRTPRPEARASVIADLMTAGVSAESAFEVCRIAEEIEPNDSVPANVFFIWIMAALQKTLQHCRRVIVTQLSIEQVAAFDLGAQLGMAAEACGAGYGDPAAQKEQVIESLRTAHASAKLAGADPSELTRLLSLVTDRAHPVSLPALQPALVAALPKLLASLVGPHP